MKPNGDNYFCRWSFPNILSINKKTFLKLNVDDTISDLLILKGKKNVTVLILKNIVCFEDLPVCILLSLEFSALCIGVLYHLDFLRSLI